MCIIDETRAGRKGVFLTPCIPIFSGQPIPISRPTPRDARGKTFPAPAERGAGTRAFRSEIARCHAGGPRLSRPYPRRPRRGAAGRSAPGAGRRDVRPYHSSQPRSRPSHIPVLATFPPWFWRRSRAPRRGIGRTTRLCTVWALRGERPRPATRCRKMRFHRVIILKAVVPRGGFDTCGLPRGCLGGPGAARSGHVPGSCPSRACRDLHYIPVRSAGGGRHGHPPSKIGIRRVERR